MVTFRQTECREVVAGVRVVGGGEQGVCVQWGHSFSSEDEASGGQPEPQGQQDTQGSQFTSSDDAGRI